jgi:outer membrane immunogenic protein
MRIFVSAMVFATAVGSVAYADGPSQRYREPVCCAAFSWTGIYVGGHSGWGSMEIFQPPAPGVDAPPVPAGGFWGGQIGANYQFARNWVVGAELDSSFARLEDSHIRPDPLFPATLLADTVKLNSLTTLRGRLGFAWDHTLFYATGGWAWSGIELTTSSSNSGGGGGGGGNPQIVTDHATVNGWTVGGGIEMKLLSNWTGKIEYQLIHSDNVTLNAQGGPTPPVHFELQTVRVGINYLFR